MAVWSQCASAHSDALIANYEQAKVPLVTGSLGIASLYSDWAYGNYHSGIANMIRSWILWVKRDWEKAGKPGGALVLGTVTTDEPWVPLALWEVDGFAKEQGIKLVKGTFPKGTTDAGPQLLRMKDAGAKQIYVLASATGTVVVLRAAKAMNLNIPLTQCAAASLGDVIASGMVIAEGIRLALDTVPPDKLTGEAIKTRGLDRINGFDGMGLTTPITYTEDDHIGQKPVRYWVAKGGFVEPLSDWMPTTTYRIPKT